MRAKQLTFFHQKSFKKFTRLEHGGELAQGRRKLDRPISTDKPMHVVLRSDKAKGEWSMLRHRNDRRIRHLVYQLAKRFNVRVYQYANAGNHLHLLVRAKSRSDFQAYLRALSGCVARAITGAKKGVRKGPFWARLAYSRIVQWGRDFLGVKVYLLQNDGEAQRMIPYQPRKTRVALRP
jgi:REP element-mobilizing transposase RayT